MADSSAPPSRRTVWHIGANVAAWALPLAVAIVAIPLLWRALGQEGYGVYILAIGYGALAGSFGSVRGAAQRVSSASGSDGLPAAVGGAYLAALGTGGVTVTAWMLFAPLFLRIAGIDPAASPNALTTFRLAAAAVPAMHVAQAARGVLMGLERHGAYSVHVATTAVVTTAGMVALAMLGYDVPDLMRWLVISHAASAVAGVIMAQAAARVRPVVSPADGWAIVRIGAALTATDTIMNVYVLAERTLMTRVLGVAAVAEYTIPLSLASALQNAMAAGGVVLLPRSGAAWARGDQAALRAMYARSVKAIAIVAVGGSTAIAGAAATIVGWWIEPEFGRQTAGVVAVLLAAYAINALATPIWFLSEGAGLPTRNTALTAAIAVVGIGSAVILIPTHGTIGVAWARALAMVAIPFFIWAGERRVLGRAERVLWTRIATSIVPAGLVLATLVVIAERQLTGIPLLLTIAGLLATYAGVLWRSGYFDAADPSPIRSGA